MLLAEDRQDNQRLLSHLLRRAGENFFNAGETEPAMVALKKAFDIALSTLGK